MEPDYPVTGCPIAPSNISVFPPLPPPPPPARLEIRDLSSNDEYKEQWTLFIHALADIQKPEHRPKASRYADIAGIHGLPYERWAGDPSVPDKNAEGTNGAVLFPVWHRPYLLAMEQSISAAAVRRAHRWTRNLDDTFDDQKKKWKAAALAVRLPYWDWTDKDTENYGLPDVLRPQSFTFELPGPPKTNYSTIENPLAGFEFGSRIPDGFSNKLWKNPVTQAPAMSYNEDWRRTYRWPTSKVNPTEDYLKIQEILKNGVERKGKPGRPGATTWLREKVALLFTFPATVGEKQKSFIWDEFSNTTFQSHTTLEPGKKAKWNPQHIDSIEAPHNMVHLLMGGYGAMSDNDYAGYDPVFWLHHANIDRILAFWEHVYNEYWMGEGYYIDANTVKPIPFAERDGTWDVDDNEAINENSELKPFRTGGVKNPYWNPKDTRFNAGRKGYTYPDIQSRKGKVSLQDKRPENPHERRKLMAILLEHFHPTKPSLPWNHWPGIIHPISGPNIHLPGGYEAVDTYRRFTVLVNAVRHAFDGSYSIQLSYKGNAIGIFTVLFRGKDSQCAACRVRSITGRRVRGLIEIPDEVVLDVIQDANLGLGEAASDISILSAEIRQRIRADLVGPTGIVLAALPVKADTEIQESGSTVDPNIIPHLELLSASIAAASESSLASGAAPDLPPALKDPDLMPIQFCDWQKHDRFDDGWKWA
ncbi:hypothetical protein HWV62_43940 [Athelia sp. TMB]|nr:hypothetical protein HWV62_43940 [Athelia sp. TMB]